MTQRLPLQTDLTSILLNLSPVRFIRTALGLWWWIITAWQIEKLAIPVMIDTADFGGHGQQPGPAAGGA